MSDENVPIAKPVDEQRARDELYLLDRGWVPEAGDKWYDGQPPKLGKKIVGKRIMPNKVEMTVKQLHVSQAPWTYSFEDAITMERRRDRPPAPKIEQVEEKREPEPEYEPVE